MKININVDEHRLFQSEKEQYYSFAVSTTVFKVDMEGFLVVGEPQLDRDSPNPNVYEFEVTIASVIWRQIS